MTLNRDYEYDLLIELRRIEIVVALAVAARPPNF